MDRARGNPSVASGSNGSTRNERSVFARDDEEEDGTEDSGAITSGTGNSWDDFDDDTESSKRLENGMGRDRCISKHVR